MRRSREWKSESYRRADERRRTEMPARIDFRQRQYRARIVEQGDLGGRLHTRAPLFLGALFDLFVSGPGERVFWATCHCMNARGYYFGYRYYLSTADDLDGLRGRAEQ